VRRKIFAFSLAENRLRKTDFHAIEEKVEGQRRVFVCYGRELCSCVLLSAYHASYEPPPAPPATMQAVPAPFPEAVSRISSQFDRAVFLLKK